MKYLTPEDKTVMTAVAELVKTWPEADAETRAHVIARLPTSILVSAVADHSTSLLFASAAPADPLLAEYMAFIYETLRPFAEDAVAELNRRIPAPGAPK